MTQDGGQIYTLFDLSANSTQPLITDDPLTDYTSISNIITSIMSVTHLKWDIKCREQMFKNQCSHSPMISLSESDLLKKQDKTPTLTLLVIPFFSKRERCLNKKAPRKV